jgi:hypothetical protein
MPIMSKVGVARQTTLMALRCKEAAEEAQVLIGEEREARVQDAHLFSRELVCWIQFAGRNGWHSVVRHGLAQHKLALAALERLGVSALL